MEWYQTKRGLVMVFLIGVVASFSLLYAGFWAGEVAVREALNDAKRSQGYIDQLRASGALHR